MMPVLETLLYLLGGLVINSFFIYPIAVYLKSRGNTGRITIHKFEPSVSILIAAYNEEKVIEQRIENLALLDYDMTKIEVFIGSDMSTDMTNEILLNQQKKYPWLKVFLAESRKGKAGILNDLIKKVKNEIIVFTDANTEFNRDTLKNLVEDFADKKIGGVCGRLILVDNETGRSEGVEESRYWKYETIIKRAEGKCGILLSANGGIFAIRRELYKEIPTEKAVTDDLFISLSVIATGFKFTYREDAMAYEDTGQDLKSEYMRKVRFGATNFQTLADFKELLNLKNIFVSYAFFSHKVTRWFLPLLLILIFMLSWVLSNELFTLKKFFLLQTAFYLLALCGYLLSLIRIRISIFSIPYFFVVSNIAITEGFIKFLRRFGTL